MDYTKLVNSVIIPKINKFGSVRKLRKQIGTSLWERKYNPVESTYYYENTDTGEILNDEPESAKVEYNLIMLMDEFETKEIDGKFIKAGDVMFYLKPSTMPEEGDTIEDTGKTYLIYHVKKLQPADVVLLYTVYARTYKNAGYKESQQ